VKNKNIFSGLLKNAGMRETDAVNAASPLDILLEEVKKDADVLAVILYGSCADKTQDPRSDIDICLLLDADKKISPEDSLKKRIHYLGRFDFDIRIFSGLPVYIRRRVLRDGKVLFSRDDDKLYDTAFKTITEFEDFEDIYREYLEETANA